jgi:hypothetical protein
MAFIYDNNSVISFADYSDVVAKDQRLFDSNEGLTDDIVEDALIRATERILAKIRQTDWWRSYYTNRDSSITIRTMADIPAVDVDNIADRQNDFTDLTVYEALAEYILPQVADFGNEDNAERAKMSFYANKSESLFAELINAGDWYDFDSDGTIASTEKDPGQYVFKRVR